MPKETKSKQQRTQDIITYFRGLPGEFYMLKGLLILETAVSNGEEIRKGWQAGRAQAKKVSNLYDGIMIAERMDEINRREINEIIATSKRSVDDMAARVADLKLCNLSHNEAVAQATNECRKVPQ